MIRIPTLLVFSASLIASGAAFAATDQGERERRVSSSPASAIQLAQTREVEIYIDQYGREVLVDPYTGEVVGIVGESGRRLAAPAPIYEPPVYEREPRYDREPAWDDGYRFDPYEEERRLRREGRLRELGRYPGARQEEYGEPARPEPPAPQIAAPQPFPQPGTGGVERAPLGAPQVPAPGDGGSIIEAEPQQQPQITPRVNLAGATEDVAKIQIVLGRVGASPGVIDGRMGDNVNKAIAAYRDLEGEALRTYDPATIDAILESTGGDAFVDYEITAVDAAGPYIASIPEDYGEKAQLDHLGYTSVVEMLAERFHMDERFLRALNPGVNFDRPGTRIRVANVTRPQRSKVARIVADKSEKQVRAYDAEGRLVAVYPATIGSQATPSPTGTHTVERIALDPEYTYNPRVNFQQGNNDRVLTIPPGPNGPVGSVWIALSKPTYGIHGTPDPTKIGKTYSNGCVRLTNWDAQELAKLVSKGVTVEFAE